MGQRANRGQTVRFGDHGCDGFHKDQGGYLTCHHRDTGGPIQSIFTVPGVLD